MNAPSARTGGGPTLNSFDPDSSLVMSKWDLRGWKVISARSFFADLERNGFET